jgi:hypothetical protein
MDLRFVFRLDAQHEPYQTGEWGKSFRDSEEDRVITMTRLGALLIILFLIAPMVRECCLPVTPTLPCHETRHADDLSCASNQPAIAVTKAAVGMGPSLLCYDLPATLDAKSAFPARHGWMADNVTPSPTPPSDLYLRTGALLI